VEGLRVVIGRIVVDDIRPRTPEGFPAKAVVGEVVRISADVFKDGHDVLAGQVRWWATAKGNGKWSSAPLHHVGNDRWEAVIEPTTLGSHEFVVEAWTERYASSWRSIDPDVPPDLTTSPAMPLWVDRERALVGAWYELFPRSHGGLAGARDHLSYVADMGFDVLYLPPIHPIGRSFRKGPNNSLTATPDDPGSPWAIGSEEGGHTAVHPDLGTLTDFEALVERAHEVGMEIALDYALQCSPDHPWVKEHPEWFHMRPDGTIAYAENPPKKYQDIYPINFWPAADGDREALWHACKEIVDFWIGKGVRIFRVDNPHTKPVAFWEWLIPAVQAKHPDVVFLAEAFTTPKMMAKLAEVGFSQSYTYFTWRTAKWELQEYLDELAHGPTADFMRPNFWPNTPDILAGPLRDGPPAAFRQRLVLAATLVPSYGIYSGYELCENEPMSDANEEYYRSEKYEVKQRDLRSPRSLAPFVTEVNDIRRRHPALQRLRNIRFHHTSNDQLIAYSKHTEDRSDVVLVVVTVDPWNTQDCTLWLDLGLLGDTPYEAFDELSGQSFLWQGSEPYVRLDPYQAAHVLHLRARLS
jgi:starch synthase (maltosyl-transferring)